MVKDEESGFKKQSICSVDLVKLVSTFNFV